MDRIFIFVCYVLVVTALCYVIFLCYEEVRYTKKKLEEVIEQMENEWFYLKTRLGRVQLEAAKRRASSKEYILFRQFMSIAGLIVFFSYWFI